eukprot:TRINITY_DN6405_c0_g2_i1.p1 TRINITY_DN6405_c0_g2~~TRINITY_DN6405_c0_g2_i1.p1  ORF type:complete len:1151 (+),score=135.04 TRINITY_DN6405_c0_g2_i1:56-3508(+)
MVSKMAPVVSVWMISLCSLPVIDVRAFGDTSLENVSFGDKSTSEACNDDLILLQDAQRQHVSMQRQASQHKKPQKPKALPKRKGPYRTYSNAPDVDPVLVDPDAAHPYHYRYWLPRPREALSVKYLLAVSLSLLCVLVPHFYAMVKRITSSLLFAPDGTRSPNAQAIGASAQSSKDASLEPHLASHGLPLGEEGEMRLLREHWSGLQESKAGPDLRLETLVDDAIPSAVALVSASGKQVTYAELVGASLKVAIEIRRWVRCQPRRCGLYAMRSEEMLIGLIGILKAGCAYVPLSPYFPDARLSYIVEDSEMGAIVTTTGLLSQVGNFSTTLPIVNVTKVVAAPSLRDSSDPLKVSADDEVVLFYTSGSTGKSKGVRLTHRAQATAVIDHADRWVKTGDRVLFSMLFNFDVSITEIFSTFAKSAALVLGPPSNEDMQALHGVIQDLKPDVITMVPSVYSMYAGQYGEAPAHTLGFIGEALPVNTWINLQKDTFTKRRVFNFYGPTECSVSATIFGPEPRLDELHGLTSVPIGKPFPCRECYVMSVEDDASKSTLLRHGVDGELWLAGAGLALGYLNMPEKTARAFVPHPFRDGQTAYRTGDLCRWLNSGDLLFLGRIDTQVKIHGLRIELEEIEHALRLESTVVEAAAVVYRNPSSEEGEGDPRLVAYVSPAGANVHSALSVCRAQLPSYMVPSSIIALDTWPRNATGKIDRLELSSRPVIASTNRAADGGGNDHEDGIVLVEDSINMMRRISRHSLAMRSHFQSLFGCFALLMIPFHWLEYATNPDPILHGGVPSSEAMSPYKVFLLVVPVHLHVFIAGSACMNSMSIGSDGSSDVSRLTKADIALVFLYFSWEWPLPEILASLVYFLTGADHYEEMRVYAISFMTRWLITLLLACKSVCILLKCLRLSKNLQIVVSALVYCSFLFYSVDDYVPRSVKKVMVETLSNYAAYVILYVVSAHYGTATRTLMQQWRSVPYVAPCLAVLSSCALRSMHDRDLYEADSWVIVRPILMIASVVLAAAAVPDLSVFRFLGGQVIAFFLLHRHLQVVICAQGITFFGILRIPSLYFAGAWATEQAAQVVGSFGWNAEVLRHVSACAAISMTLLYLVFFVALSCLFRLLVDVTMSSIGAAIQYAKNCWTEHAAGLRFEK